VVLDAPSSLKAKQSPTDCSSLGLFARRRRILRKSATILKIFQKSPSSGGFKSLPAPMRCKLGEEVSRWNR
jgi:hypothetical protein